MSMEGIVVDGGSELMSTLDMSEKANGFEVTMLEATKPKPKIRKPNLGKALRRIIKRREDPKFKHPGPIFRLDQLEGMQRELWDDLGKGRKEKVER